MSFVRYLVTLSLALTAGLTSILVHANGDPTMVAGMNESSPTVLSVHAAPAHRSRYCRPICWAQTKCCARATRS